MISQSLFLRTGGEERYGVRGGMSRFTRQGVVAVPFSTVCVSWVAEMGEYETYSAGSDGRSTFWVLS